jgi:hypothetical protein
MPHILETTKTNARHAALVAVGVPVVLFDRVSDQLNTRIGLDSYVGLARERGEHALDGYSTHAHSVTRRVRSALRPALWCGRMVAARIAPAKVAPAPSTEPEPAPAATAETTTPASRAGEASRKLTAKKPSKKVANASR